MSFPDPVVGSMVGGAGACSAMGGALSGLLGGEKAGGTASPGIGGRLGGFVSEFGWAGPGHVVLFHPGNGPNQTASLQQPQSGFGENQTQGTASEASMQPQGFLSRLSWHRPDALHSLTPTGRLPREDTLSAQAAPAVPT